MIVQVGDIVRIIRTTVWDTESVKVGDIGIVTEKNSHKTFDLTIVFPNDTLFGEYGSLYCSSQVEILPEEEAMLWKLSN